MELAALLKERLEKEQTILAAFEESSARYPDRSALIFLGTRFSYRALRDLIHRFAAACHELGVSPSRTLMVGDSENDVLAAQAAGMKVAGLTYGYNYGRPIADSRPDWVYEQFAKLDALLAE